MRIALIADIHGNLPALEAVLEELEGERIDRFLCLGDVAVGPQGAESVERVAELGCPVVMGNWDSYFVHGFPEPTNDLSRKLFAIGAWWLEGLTPDHLATMDGYRSTLELDVGGEQPLLAFHGSPRSFEDVILATTPDDELEQMLDGHAAPVMVGGHTHFQMLRRHDEEVIVNPGSVGLPFARPAPLMQISPWAEYGLLSVENGRLAFELRRTSFDVDAYIHRVLESGMPYSAWWAGLWIWKPPLGMLHGL